MVVVTASQTLSNPKQAAAILDDFPNISAWSRGVVESSSVKGDNEVGAERRCVFDTKGKQWVEEVVRERSANSWTVDIVRASMPMKRASAIFTIEGREITASFDYAMKGIMAPMGYIMKGQMRKTFENLLVDLETASA